MIWYVLAAILGTAAFASGLIAICGVLVSTDEGIHAFIVGAVMALVCGLFIFGTMKAGIAGTRHIGEASCESFGQQTGYESRYLVTTWIDSGECYVMFDGNWVPRDQLWAEMGPAGDR